MSALSITLWALLEAFISIFIGAYTCRSIPFARTTLRDFGFLTVNVLLPCLALYNVASAATPVMLLRMLVLICFAVLQIALSYGCGWVIARVLFRCGAGDDDGLPAELRKDIRLELLYDTAPSTSSNNNNNNNNNTNDATTNERTAAVPYVALVLHDRLRGLDLTTRELLSAMEVPSAAAERLPGYAWSCMIACSVQNTLSLPLALLENLLAMLPWVDFGAGVSYAFLFHAICLVYLSGCAPYLVQRAERACRRRRLIRLILQRTKHLSSCVDASTQTVRGRSLRSYAAADKGGPGALQIAGDENRSHATTATPKDKLVRSSTTVTQAQSVEAANNNNNNNITSSTNEDSTSEKSKETATAIDDKDSTNAEDVTQVPHDWPAAGRVRIVFASDLPALRPHAAQNWRRWLLRPGRRMLRQLATYLPFLAILLGLVIGIVPLIRGLFFDGGFLEMFTDAISLVAQGGIPSTLLLLGANLGGPATFAAITNSNNSSTEPLAGPTGKQQSAEQNVNFSLAAENVYLSSDEDAAADNDGAGREGEENGAAQVVAGAANTSAALSPAATGGGAERNDITAAAAEAAEGLRRSLRRGASVDSSSISEADTELETSLERSATVPAAALRLTHDEATQSRNPSFFPRQNSASHRSGSNTMHNSNNNAAEVDDVSEDDEEREVPEIDLHESFTLQTLVAERAGGAQAGTAETGTMAASPTMPSAPRTLLEAQEEKDEQKKTTTTAHNGEAAQSSPASLPATDKEGDATRREGAGTPAETAPGAQPATLPLSLTGNTSTGVNNASMRSEPAAVVVPVEVEETIASVATLRAMLSLKHVQPRFVLGVSAGRLLLCPAVTLCVLWLCVKAMPWLFGGAGSLDRTFLLVLVLEIIAPTAVNSALLFRSQNFMVREWAEMLFVQNLLCLLSTVLWCSVALSLLHTPAPQEQQPPV